MAPFIVIIGTCANFLMGKDLADGPEAMIKTAPDSAFRQASKSLKSSWYLFESQGAVKGAYKAC